MRDSLSEVTKLNSDLKESLKLFSARLVVLNTFFWLRAIFFKRFEAKLITYQLKYGESALEESNGHAIDSPNTARMLSQKVNELEKDKAELNEKLECIQNSDTEFLEEEMLILVCTNVKLRNMVFFMIYVKIIPT